MIDNSAWLVSIITAFSKVYLHGIVKNCSNTIANALVLLQSWPKPLISS